MNTGEFAKRCGTGKRTIFHYEQMGLLKPVAIHENGYREFSDSQLEIMDMIRILQGAGFSLEQIREIIAKDPEVRRKDFFEAEASLEQRIQDLARMKRYIQKKRQLWQDYCSFQEEKRPYGYEFCRMTYTAAAVDAETHFFSFLQDGDNDLFGIDASGNVFVMREDPAGVCREGMALRFFLEIPSASQELSEKIQKKLREFSFCGEPIWYLRALPHLMLAEQGSAVLQVTVFGSFSENTENIKLSLTAPGGTVL